MTDNERIAAAGKLSLAANRQFTNENRELLASFDQDKFWKAVLAFVQLEARAEIAEANPSKDFYLGIIRKACLTLLDEGSLDDAIAAPITKLGQQALDAMRRATGIGAADLPTPEPVVTAEQRLEAEVVSDWNSLPGDKIRKKRDSSKAYAATLARLLETDKLSPHASVKVTF